MPYRSGERLPGERASRLGHLEVLKSELVNKLIKNFERNITINPIKAQRIIFFARVICSGLPEAVTNQYPPTIISIGTINKER